MLSSKWDNFFLVIIVLSIIQLFLEELAVIANWMVLSRHILIYLGFLFDLIFTIEFIIRLSIAAKNGKAGIYLKYERGWIDFLASIPLLLLYSGPMVYYISKITQVTMISGIATFKTLKLIKMIRISRILRLLRILKIFGKISKSAAKMVKHHVATVATTALASLIIGLFLIQLLFNALGWPGIEIFGNKREQQYKDTIIEASVISEQYNIEIKQALILLLGKDKYILNLSHNGQDVIEKDEFKNIFNRYDISDLHYFEIEKIKVWYHIKDVNMQVAKNNIEIFLLVLFILCGILFFYAKHFIKYVALPLDALQQKITDPDYNPKLDITKAYEDDEVFEIFKILGKKDKSVGGY